MFPRPIPIFKVGDIVGNRLDGTRIIYKIEYHIGGDYFYHTLRTDPDDIKVNGKTAKYNQASLDGWKWLRYEAQVELLYGDL